MYKILIIEDDSTIAGIIAESLNKWGFEAEIAADYSNILHDFNAVQPHLVLMDINLPYYDGFYWCEKIRNISNVPIIFISSRTDDNDKIRGIIGGGDDYIEKPFSMDMLITKIKAMLRRAYAYLDMSYTTVSYADIILDIEKSVISCGKEYTELTHNECQIMSMLIKASGKIVSRSQIMKYLWDNEDFIDENTLTVNINRIRNKLKNITESELIITVKGKGYKLNEI